MLHGVKSSAAVAVGAAFKYVGRSAHPPGKPKVIDKAPTFTVINDHFPRRL